MGLHNRSVLSLIGLLVDVLHLLSQELARLESFLEFANLVDERFLLLTVQICWESESVNLVLI